MARVSVVETVGLYIGVPLGIVLILTVAVFGRTAAQSTSRYRPGRPWTHEPVWYLPHTEDAAQPSTAKHAALTQATRAALSRGADPTGPTVPTESAGTAAVGGAVGEW